MENGNYSCVDCIWHDQCESVVPCDFFDAGKDILSLTDEDISSYTETRRSQFEEEYREYIKEYGDGNIE